MRILYIYVERILTLFSLLLRSVAMATRGIYKALSCSSRLLLVYISNKKKERTEREKRASSVFLRPLREASVVSGIDEETGKNIGRNR